MNLFDLTGKVALVTGASSGIGAAAAKAYAAAGADVVICARRKEKLEAVAEEIRKTGREVLVVECDVTIEEQVKNVADKAIEKFGKIDILLNNAGGALSGRVDQVEEAQWDAHMALNLKSLFLMSKHVILI